MVCTLLGFPKSMQVAVCVHGLDLITLAKCKTDRRLIARMQQLALVALFGLQGDPLDKMFGQHGMVNRADPYRYDISLDLIYRDMFFSSSVCRAGDDFSHFLAAAHYRYTRILHLGNDIAAMIANVKFLFHFDVPPDNLSNCVPVIAAAPVFGLRQLQHIRFGRISQAFLTQITARVQAVLFMNALVWGFVSVCQVLFLCVITRFYAKSSCEKIFPSISRIFSIRIFLPSVNVIVPSY